MGFLKGNKVHYLLLFAAVFFVYFGVLGYSFVWDDISLVVQNNLIRSFRNISLFFTSDLHATGGNSANFYRPLQLVSFALDYFFFSLNATAFHFTNVFIHCLNVVCLCFLFTLLGGKKQFAFMSAFLFGIFPVNTEAVTYISGRADLLVSFFMLLSFVGALFYFNKNKISFLCLSLFAFACALLSKENALILPVIFSVYVFSAGCWKKNQAKILLWGYFGLSAVYIILRKTILDFSTVQISFHMNLFTRILSAFEAFFIYIKILLFPVGLHMERFFCVPEKAFDAKVLMGVLCFSGFLFLVRFLYRKNKTACFGMAWFLLGLLPVLNIFVVLNAFVSEHWLYFPSMGLFLAVCLGFSFLGKTKKAFRSKIILFVVLSVIYILLTQKANKAWENNFTLYSNIIKNGNPTFRIYTNLGNEYAKAKQYNKAIKCYAKALKLNSACADACNNMGIVLNKLGKRDQALKYYEKVQKLNPDYKEVYNNLGNLYKQKGQYEKALESYEKALEADPLNSRIYTNTADLYISTGMYNRAIDACQKALKLDKLNINAYNNLGIVYIKTKAYGDAVFYLEKGLKLYPDSQMLKDNLSLLLRNARYERKKRSAYMD